MSRTERSPKANQNGTVSRTERSPKANQNGTVSRTERSPKANQNGAADGGVDHLVELMARWVAARTTRRSFLARLAKVAVLVATGPSLAVLLARRAEARVCGQSGVTPKCPTFDCDGEDDVWGWCWYASPGCCANGGLKKICDCCTVNWPNVHGYCPAGTNVRCIMESCYADPRVLAVGLSPMSPDEVFAGTTAPTPTVFVAGDHSVITSPLGAQRNLPVVVSQGSRLDPRVIKALQEHGTTQAVAVVGDLSSTAAAELARYVAVELVDPGEDSGSAFARWTAGVAKAVQDAGGARRVVAVTQSALNDVGVTASALASHAGMAVVVDEEGLTRAHELLRPVVSWVAGPGWDPTVVGRFPGTKLATTAAGAEGMRELAQTLADREQLEDLTLVLAPASLGAADAARLLPRRPGVVVLHADPETEPEVRSFVRVMQSRLGDAVYVDTTDGLVSEGVWQMQSALNHFDTHQLVGRSGQGLPVISQPRAERPVGAARVFSYAPDEVPEDPPYWLSRADPGRASR